MSKENVEWPTFNPDTLPDETTLHAQAETDFKLFEEGVSPDEIAQMRENVRRLTEDRKKKAQEEKDV